MGAYRKERRRADKLAGELAACRDELSGARADCDRLRADYETLRTARLLEAGAGDVKEARDRLTKLIREVDKCIALIDIY